MKLIKKIIILFFIIVIGLPLAMIGAALIKDATPPTYLENVDVENVSVEDEVKKEMQKYLTQFLVGNQKVVISEQKVNKLIYTALQDIISEMDPDLPNLRGLWVKFNNDELTVYTLVGYHKISTTFTIKVDVKEENNNTKISLNTMKVGQLPIPKFILTFLLEKLAPEEIEEFEEGEINIEELYVTILGSFLQEQLEKQVKSDFLIFDYVSFEKNKFTIHCKINQDSTHGLAIQNTLDELKNVIQDNEKLLNKLIGADGILDENDPIEQALSEDFKALQEIIKNPTTITDEDLDVIMSLQDNFEDIPDEKKEQIMEIIEGSISEEIKDEFLQALNELNVTDIDKISDLILGNKKS